MENDKPFDILKDFEVRKQLTKAEMLDKLNEWARSGRYEKDMVVTSLKTRKRVCEVLTKYYNPDQDDIRIIDVASGTGLVGMELLKLGFKNMDAVDPSDEMMKVARDRNIYQNHYTEYVDGTRLACIDTGITALDIDKLQVSYRKFYGRYGELLDKYNKSASCILTDLRVFSHLDSYDVAIVVGGFSVGFMPTNGLFELIRMVKIGGLLILSVWEGFDQMIDEYRDRFFPLTEEMEKSGELTLLQQDLVEEPDTKPCGLKIRLVYKVHVSESCLPHLKPLKPGNSEPHPV